MTIPHTRKRLPIPSIFRNYSGAGMEGTSNGTDTPSPNILPGPPILLPSSQNYIQPKPSNNKVKYSPSTRGLKGIYRELIRPKSPPLQHASLTLGKTSGNVTLVDSTAPLCEESVSSGVFMERAKSPFPLKVLPPTNVKEEHVLTITSKHQNEISHTKNKTEAPLSTSAYNQTLSDLISQIIKNRFRVDHKEFMTTWSAAEIKLYENRWKKLVKSSKSAFYWPTTRFAEIPWPVLSAAVLSFPSPDIINHMNVARFFISPYLGQQKSSLDIILDEIERWNDFELMCRVLRKVRKSDRRKVEIAWSRVVLALMEVRGELMARRRIR